MIRGGSLIYIGLTIDMEADEKLQEVLMSMPYMFYLFLFLCVIMHFLIYYISAHINSANDRDIFNQNISNLTKKTLILLFVVFPIFFIIFLLMSIFSLLDIIAQWTLIKMISIFNIASPGILISYYIFLNFKFSGRPFRDEHLKKNTNIIIRNCIYWSVSRIVSGIIYIALKITNLKSLILGDMVEGGGKTVNIILIFLFFIVLEIFPIYATLEHNFAKTFIKEEQVNEPVVQNNDITQNLIRNTMNSTDNNEKIDEQIKVVSNNPSPVKNKRIEVQNYLIKKEDLKIGETIFEKKNGLGHISRAKYKNENVIIRIVQFDRLSRYNIEDIINDYEKLINLNHKNISTIKGYCISDDNRVILLNNEYKNGSLYDYIKSGKNLSKEEKLNIVLGTINGLEYLHKNNIVHCHLSSKNILLDDELNPVIVDFGFRNLYELANLFNKYINKSGYSPPEVLNTSSKFFKIPENSNENLEKIDIYSYGMILWEIIENKVPFDVKLADIKKLVLEEKVRPEIPENIKNELSNLIRNCLDSNISRRPSEKEIIQCLNSNKDLFDY